MHISCTFSTIAQAESTLAALQSAILGLDSLQNECSPGRFDREAALDLPDSPDACSGISAAREMLGIVPLSNEAISQKATGGGATVNFYCPEGFAQQAVGLLKAAGARKISLCG